MLLKGSHPRVLSGFRVQRGVHCASFFCRIPPWSLKLESTSPAVAYACRKNYSYLLKVEHLYRILPSQSPHPDMTPVVRNVRSPAHRQNQQKRGPSGNSQLPPATRRISVSGWQEEFHSWREFRTLYNPRSELHPLIFAEHFSRCRYHSTRDFHPIRYTAIVNKYSDRNAVYNRS